MKLPLKIYGFLVLGFLLFGPTQSWAANLQVSPSTGVYTTGSTFTARVVVNTDGKSINAAEGTLKYNPAELSVVSVNRANSIFNLWVTEPTFSNTAGTISFSGGLPSGYTGNGTVFSVTFRTLTTGSVRISYSGGAVLANDGRGTNILSGMSGGTYTIQAPTSQPEAEVIEYVAPANTPAAPKISSMTHPDPLAWSSKKVATLSWILPNDVTQVRTLLDNAPTTVPTRVYETPISSITLEDLPEGESYFHLQFRNSEGWGRVTHYRLAVDTKNPEGFVVTRSEEVDLASPQQTLQLKTDQGPTDSPVRRFMVKIDGEEPYEFIDEAGKGILLLPVLSPGYRMIIIEAFDSAGNSVMNSVSFTISAFDKPVFTEYPNEINEQVIPVIRGTTRPNAEVVITVQKIGSDIVPYTVTSDSAGVFTFIPEGTLTLGVYELTAKATDSFGAQSDVSDPIRIAVQQPGYIQIGEKLIGALSVVMSLLGLAVLLGVSIWLLFLYVRRLRKRISIESKEVVAILEREFKNIDSLLELSKERLLEAKKVKKLSSVEEDIFTDLAKEIQGAKNRVAKEVHDVEILVEKNQK